jgi:hypothetical protein
VVLFLLATVADITTRTMPAFAPDAIEEKLSLSECGDVLTESKSDSYLFQLKAKHKRCLQLDLLLVLDAHESALHGPRHVLDAVAKRLEISGTRGSHRILSVDKYDGVPGATQPRLPLRRFRSASVPRQATLLGRRGFRWTTKEDSMKCDRASLRSLGLLSYNRETPRGVWVRRHIDAHPA